MPYRFYNVDHFEKLKTQSVYASFPWAILPNNEYTQASLWLNAADSYAIPRLYKEGSHLHWMSECGSFNLFHFIAENPHSLSQVLSEITGPQRLPPIFSLGYHQCRWNYFSQDELMEVDKKFNEFQIPLDTLWLDIEYTDKKKYMTWNSKFPYPKEMIEALKKENRYLVCIVDPHISTTADYFIYKEASIKNYFVKKPNSKDDFTGKCWAPNCSWIDFLNPDARNFWGNAYKNFLGTNSNLYIWNDMNEPSCFTGMECTIPKNAT